MPCQRAISPVWERLPPRFTSPSSWFSWWSSDSFVFGVGQTVARVMLINHEPKLLYPIGWTHCVSYLWHSRSGLWPLFWASAEGSHTLWCAVICSGIGAPPSAFSWCDTFSVIWDWLSPLRTPSHFLSKLWSMCVELYLVHYGGWCFWRDFSNWMWSARLLTVRKDGPGNDSLTQTGFFHAIWVVGGPSVVHLRCNSLCN